ncbi:MAG: hypothetical protein PVI59_11040 [Anaerolineae bacterium]|jgi:hypothetical protein
MTNRTQLLQTSHCLTHLLRLGAAFAPFRATVESIGAHALPPEDRRRLCPYGGRVSIASTG